MLAVQREHFDTRHHGWDAFVGFREEPGVGQPGQRAYNLLVEFRKPSIPHRSLHGGLVAGICVDSDSPPHPAEGLLIHSSQTSY